MQKLVIDWNEIQHIILIFYHKFTQPIILSFLSIACEIQLIAINFLNFQLRIRAQLDGMNSLCDVLKEGEDVEFFWVLIVVQGGEEQIIEGYEEENEVGLVRFICIDELDGGDIELQCDELRQSDVRLELAIKAVCYLLLAERFNDLRGLLLVSRYFGLFDVQFIYFRLYSSHNDLKCFITIRLQNLVQAKSYQLPYLNIPIFYGHTKLFEKCIQSLNLLPKIFHQLILSLYVHSQPFIL